jgi:hypothetical protein
VIDQSNAKWRVEVVQENGSDLGNAVAVGVAQQRDPVGIGRLCAREPLDPAGDDVLRPEYWRLRTVALDHQNIAVRKDVERAWMLEACRKCLRLETVRHLRLVVTPWFRSRNLDRRKG